MIAAGVLVAPHVHAERVRELPLILRAEREELLSEWIFAKPHTELGRYLDVIVVGALDRPNPPEDFEPFGLHIDKKAETFKRMDNGLKGPPDEGRSVMRSTRGRVCLQSLAMNLALFSHRNVLMSARVEKRECANYRVGGKADHIVENVEDLLRQEDVEVRPIGHDTLVLLEAPGTERPFPYTSRSRAIQYEAEREEWLAKNEDYRAQGLIYQPTGETPGAYPARGARVRHAAAALAKIANKEVFVAPDVEKREFKAPRGGVAVADTREAPLSELEKQLEKARVKIIELNARSLALVAN